MRKRETEKGRYRSASDTPLARFLGHGVSPADSKNNSKVYARRKKKRKMQRESRRRNR